MEHFAKNNWWAKYFIFTLLGIDAKLKSSNGWFKSLLSNVSYHHQTFDHSSLQLIAMHNRGCTDAMFMQTSLLTFDFQL